MKKQNSIKEQQRILYGSQVHIPCSKLPPARKNATKFLCGADILSATHSISRVSASTCPISALPSTYGNDSEVPPIGSEHDSHRTCFHIKPSRIKPSQAKSIEPGSLVVMDLWVAETTIEFARGHEAAGMGIKIGIEVGQVSGRVPLNALQQKHITPKRS